MYLMKKEGQSVIKCILVPKKSTCPILKVHNTIMEEVTEDTYLGDIISSDGKNTKNIEKKELEKLQK